MKEANIFERIFLFLREIFVPQRIKEKENKKCKEEMCRRAIQGNCCPKDCQICAWYGGDR